MNGDQPTQRTPVSSPVRAIDALFMLPQLAQEASASGSPLILCLQLLLDLGFDRARYYQIDEGDPDTGALYVLTHHITGSEEVEPWPPPGYTIPKGESAAHLAGDDRNVVSSNDYPLLSRQPWYSDLNLSGKLSVDIPVIRDGKTVGLLAADCSQERLDLSDEARFCLQTIGYFAGSSQQHEAESNLLVDLGIKNDSSGSSPDEYARLAASILQRELRAQVVSTFRFEWRQERLVKIAESVVGVTKSGDQGTRPDLGHKEAYGLGDTLVGKAWDDPTLRYIPDVPRFFHSHQSLVPRVLLDYYSNRLGHEIKSFLFVVLGVNEKRYLLRMINRADLPALPFLSLRQRCIGIAQVLALGFDDAVARRRLEFFRATARAGISEVTRPDLVVEQAMIGWADEGITDLLLICRRPGSGRPAFVMAGGQFRALAAQVESLHFPDDIQVIMEPTRSATSLSVSALERLMPGLSDVVGAVPGISGQSIVRLDARANETSAFLLAAGSRRVTTSATERFRAAESFTAAQALLDMCVEAVDSKYMHLTAKAARQALGYVGHELGTPLAILGDAAVAAVLHAQDLLGPKSPEAQSLLRHYYRIQDSRGGTNSAFRLSQLVVQIDGDASLPLFFESVPFRDVVDLALRQMSSSTRGSQQSTSGRRLPGSSSAVRFAVDTSVERAGDLVGDKYLLAQLVTNLLDNAVKYSTPRARSTPMEIQVSAANSTDGWLRAVVRNWGQPIDEAVAEMIFEPFIRGEQHHRVRVVRGMGLGLYLSRVIAIAHGGSIHLTESRVMTEKDDWGQEGALTTFELRLPRNRSVGPHRFRWSRDRQEGTLRAGH